MTNEMISVPRHDLALALGTQDEGVTPYLQKRAGDRLRALLAQPAEQLEGEPIGHVYTMEALVPGGGVRYHAELYRPIPSGTKLYTSPPEQPAPVAVALPERKAHRDHGLTALDREADGWNACLDEVARLNPPQQ